MSALPGGDTLGGVGADVGPEQLEFDGVVVALSHHSVQDAAHKISGYFAVKLHAQGAVDAGGVRQSGPGVGLGALEEDGPQVGTGGLGAAFADAGEWVGADPAFSFGNPQLDAPGLVVGAPRVPGHHTAYILGFLAGGDVGGFSCQCFVAEPAANDPGANKLIPERAAGDTLDEQPIGQGGGLAVPDEEEGAPGVAALQEGAEGPVDVGVGQLDGGFSVGGGFVVGDAAGLPVPWRVDGADAVEGRGLDENSASITGFCDLRVVGGGVPLRGDGRGGVDVENIGLGLGRGDGALSGGDPVAEVVQLG